MIFLGTFCGSSVVHECCSGKRVEMKTLGFVKKIGITMLNNQAPAAACVPAYTPAQSEYFLM